MNSWASHQSPFQQERIFSHTRTEPASELTGDRDRSNERVSLGGERRTAADVQRARTTAEGSTVLTIVCRISHSTGKDVFAEY
jgi:hypothetical protein